MPILAIDTATLVSSVAIIDNNKLLAELTLQTKLTHSEVLMPHIQHILAMTKLKLNDLSGIAVSIGPGSFTGLRIGLTTAKSLAYAAKLPIVGVSTLAALATQYPVPGIYIAPLLDAQKGNVYTALYRWEANELTEVVAPMVEAFDLALEKRKNLELPTVFIGESAVKQQAAISAAGGNIFVAKVHTIMPRAAGVGLLGINMLNAGVRDDVMTLKPIYIRRSEAEELWEKRQEKQQNG